MDAGGMKRIAEGREAEIYLLADGTILKLFRPDTLGDAAEAAAFAAINAAGGPAPRLLERTQLDGRPALVMERVRGADMLALLERGPWRLFRLARALADAHVKIHRTAAPPGLPDLKANLASRIAAATPAHLRNFALEELEPLPEGDRLCHGDFHPGNVLVSQEGASVIDWSLASSGHPAADFARTALLLRLGDPPPGMSAPFRVVVFAGRALFARRYAAAYTRLAPVPATLRRSFEIAHAAARFAEGIEIETRPLTKFLERAAAGRP